MERALYFTKYRNIGVSKPQRLVLNNFTDKSNIGSLVILVGPNNAGKSNILDALENFGKAEFGSKDVTTLSFEEQDAIPQLSLSCKDNDEYTLRRTYNQSEPYIVCSANAEEIVFSQNELQELLSSLTDLSNCIGTVARNYGYGSSYGIVSRFRQIINDANDGINKKETVSIGSLLKPVEEYLTEKAHDSVYQSAWNNFVNSNKHEKFVRFCLNKTGSNLEKLEQSFKEKYKIRFKPEIIRYVDTPIGNKNIIADKGNIGSNRFFKVLFEAIDYSFDTLGRAYEAFSSNKNKGILNTQKSEINKKLEKIADDFNRLYCVGDERYRFEIDLETNNIFFNIYNGNKDVSLDNQSTGFKWFFDLYFNLLSRKTLKCGDIILMDEPAINLSVQGQRELRVFLKDFAIKNGVTLVVATHCPFLIDIDCLDELRVIETRDGEAFINNDFSAVNQDDPDSLLPVKRALTVESCHLYDPDKRVVFVEGITDYNYLIAFKKILGITDDIVFLPIHGVGKGNAEDRKKSQREISAKLIKLRKHDPVLLVDGDVAGKSMKEVNKESELTVIELTDVDASFKTIETLFDKADLEKFELVDAKGKYIKHASSSALIKTFADNYEFSDQTKANFKKLFERLID